jgi:hypothetical protein
LVCLIAAVLSGGLLVFVLTVATKDRLFLLADHFSASGQVTGFAEKEIINLRLCLIAAVVVCCVLVLRVYLERLIPSSMRKRVMPMFDLLLPNSRPKLWVVVMALTGTALITYLPCLRFAFLGEDFMFISWGTRALPEVFMPVTGWYHYKPVGFILMGLPARLFGASEFVYHLNVMLLHVANCFAAFFFIEYLTGKRGLAFMSALLYSVFWLHYEAVFWCEGQFYQYSTLFSIVSLWLFIAYLKDGRLRTYALFLIVFTLNILTYEQGIAILGICFCYEALLRNRPGAYSSDVVPTRFCWKMGKKYAVPACLVLALGLFKAVVVGSTGVFVLSPLRMARLLDVYLLSFATPGFYFGLVAGLRATGSHLGFVLVLALMSGVFVYSFKKDRLYAFLLSWMVVSMFPNALFGSFSSRNYPFPSIAYSVLLASCISRASVHVARFLNVDESGDPAHGDSGLMGWATGIILFVVLFASFQFLRDRQEAWARTSDFSRNLTKNLIELLGAVGPEKQVHIVGRPAGIETNEFWPPPAVFSPSFREEVAWRAGISQEQISEYVGGAAGFDLWRQRLQSCPDSVVLMYDYSEQRFIALKPGA